MTNDIIKELEAAKAKVASLENSLASEIQDKLSSLPRDYGFDSLAAFIKALKHSVNGSSAVRAPKAAKKTGAAKAGKSGTRARITPEVKQQVKEAVAAGKTGAAIAKDLGISLPSVQNIKKELGLVKKRR